MLIGRYTAFLDANVLHPAFVRAALLWFADERLFIPVWSPDVLIEWKRSVKRRFPDTDDQKIESLQQTFNENFPGAEVNGYHDLIEGIKLPDPDDRHVLAAALVGRCNGIITANLKHFPQDVAEKYNIEIVHPDDFIVNIIDLHPSRALTACKRQREAMSATKPSAAEYLERFEQAGLIQSHQRLKQHEDLL